MNLTYSDFKYKTAIVDYLKLLIAETYPQYKFKSFLHADFAIPYDFKLKKHSCLVNDKNTMEPLYLLNMYKLASYDPIQASQGSIRYAHPLIKYRILYIDLYMVDRKLNTTKAIDEYDQAYTKKFINTFEEVLKYEEEINWSGIYVNDAYEKTEYNQSMNMSNPIRNIIV